MASVLCAHEKTNANNAKPLDAVNATNNASPYNCRTAAWMAGGRSCRAKTDFLSFSMSYSDNIRGESTLLMSEKRKRTSSVASGPNALGSPAARRF